ncbi:MAG: VTT domain-containing protein, partial [Phycisphaerales bacterium]|nr:VTT domain-containing protein [Phycisphaerales bacterium]
ALVAGVLVAASLQYGLARRLLRRPIERSMSARPRFAALVRAVRRNEFRLQGLIRLTPINPASTSYALGAARVRFIGFMVACVALLPGAMVEFALGRAGRHVARMTGRGEPTILLHDAMLLGGIAAIVVAVAVISRVARQAVQRELEVGPDDPTAR